jgi:hypothetical protein
VQESCPHVVIFCCCQGQKVAHRGEQWVLGRARTACPAKGGQRSWACTALVSFTDGYGEFVGLAFDGVRVFVGADGRDPVEVSDVLVVEDEALLGVPGDVVPDRQQRGVTSLWCAVEVQWGRKFRYLCLAAIGPGTTVSGEAGQVATPM